MFAPLNKITILLTLYFTSCAASAQVDLIELRQLYYNASKDRSDAEKFEKVTRETTGINNFLLSGYNGMAWMIKANHAYNPYNKLSYFFKGRDLLDAAILSDAGNIELRFLRFCVQTNAPAFLAYSGAIKADKEVILQKFPFITDQDLKKRIRDYMLSCGECNNSEQRVFK